MLRSVFLVAYHIVLYSASNFDTKLRLRPRPNPANTLSMILSLSAHTLESITTYLDSADFPPKSDQPLSLQRQPPVTHPHRDRFHRHCRILVSQQVKTLMPSTLRRADLTTVLSVEWVHDLPIPVSWPGLFPTFPGNHLWTDRHLFFICLQEIAHHPHSSPGGLSGRGHRNPLGLVTRPGSSRCSRRPVSATAGGLPEGYCYGSTGGRSFLEEGHVP